MLKRLIMLFYNILVFESFEFRFAFRFQGKFLKVSSFLFTPDNYIYNLYDDISSVIPSNDLKC